ncbi:hypothetical protein SNOG_00547 [Parastagonospora nodorum SN15]|uniref:Uncharacterized protein n=1 Tax=Phaeosphaeria nodorum (strain SN15 / ATCC MYA-4574 / FGSC 10173) TaxID=321614 RepID=Q0V617_PHANO|nr:hypothetical protein SNOG_00547 [Parastagonospora nodorum SN15]EAT92042.1 hypothetical protein SNOG_00547 [Parastagonospora nodorum SN15]
MHVRRLGSMQSGLTARQAETESREVTGPRSGQPGVTCLVEAHQLLAAHALRSIQTTTPVTDVLDLTDTAPTRPRSKPLWHLCQLACFEARPHSRNPWLSLHWEPPLRYRVSVIREHRVRLVRCRRQAFFLLHHYRYAQPGPASSSAPRAASTPPSPTPTPTPPPPPHRSPRPLLPYFTADDPDTTAPAIRRA